MMSVKKMVDLYVEYGVSEDTWKMMYEMTCHNLISRDNWTKFFNKCKGWYLNEETNTIDDSETGKTVYVYDDNGNLRKVA